MKKLIALCLLAAALAGLPAVAAVFSDTANACSAPPCRPK